MPDENRRSLRVLWLTATLFCAVAIADSWFRWATYQYRTFDLTFYAHTFWLALQGQWHSTLLDVSLMGNHAEPICFLLLPFFWIGRHPMFFVVVQALLVATMPFTGYRIARAMEFEPRSATWLGIAILVMPATGYMTLHEFHPETLAAPLLMLMLEARLRGRIGIYWLWFVLTLACKENIGLLLIAFCATFCVLDRKRGIQWQMAFNITPCALAAIWTASYIFWLAPLLNGGRVDYGELYRHLGGMSGVAASPANAVRIAWHAATSGNLVWGLLLPCGLLPLLRPRWLVISVPILAQHLLSSRPSEWTIYFHYAAPLVPLMWYATAEACARFRSRNVLAGFVLTAAALCQLWIGPVRSVAETAKHAGAFWEKAQRRSEMLASIPKDASVVAGLPYLSHLAMRERLHSLHHIMKGLRTLSRSNYIAPPPTDVVLIDALDTATFDRGAGYYHPAMQTTDGRVIPDSEVLLDDFLAQANWRSFSRNELTLLIRTEPPQLKPALGLGTKLDDKHRLVSAQFAPALPGDLALIIFNLEIEANPSLVPWVSLILRGVDGRDYLITKGPFGLGHPPQRLVTESWAIRRPSSLPPGKYRAFLEFYDHHEAIYPPDEQRFQRSGIEIGGLQVP